MIGHFQGYDLDKDIGVEIKSLADVDKYVTKLFEKLPGFLPAELVVDQATIDLLSAELGHSAIGEVVSTSLGSVKISLNGAVKL